MEVSVDSMIEKPFCSRNYDEKLEIANKDSNRLKYRSGSGSGSRN